MASINWAFLCDYAFVTPDGKASMIGLFDRIGIRTAPAIHPQMFIVFSVTINPEDGAIKFGARLTSPSTGNDLAFVENPPVSVHGGVSTNNVIFAFYGMSLPEAGEYRMEILANGQTVHFVPLIVNLIR